jgi:hypothetical protein
MLVTLVKILIGALLLLGAVVPFAKEEDDNPEAVED